MADLRQQQPDEVEVELPRSKSKSRLYQIVVRVATWTGIVAGAVLVAPAAAALQDRTPGVGSFYSSEFQTRDKTRRVVAVGDSTLSGAGAGDYNRENPPWEPDNPGCYSSLNSIPNLVAESLQTASGDTGEPELATNLACAGKGTEQIMSLQVPQIPGDADLVLVSGGANNPSIAITKRLADCVDMAVLHSRPLCEPLLKDVWEEGLRTLPGELDAYYSSVAKAAPNALKVVVGYANVFSKGGVDGDCDFMRKSDIEYFEGMLRKMNKVIEDKAKEHGFAFLNPDDDVPELDGHRTCDRTRGGTSWVQDFTWKTFYEHLYEINGTPLQFSYYGGHPIFHGRPEWQQAIAAKVTEMLSSNGFQIQVTWSGGSESRVAQSRVNESRVNENRETAFSR